jgi:choline dehydrogenase-like flavoprotein
MAIRPTCWPGIQKFLFLKPTMISCVTRYFNIMHCVIGSGPAGVSCAKALLARGATVLMLDAGIELEQERAKLVQRLGSTAADEWLAEDTAVLKNEVDYSSGRIPQKLIFGSDYPYREADKHLPRRESGATIKPSLALGGFSTVWGAAMLPYRDEDIEDWPVKTEALAPHYRAVAKFTGLAAQRDDLEEWFPLYTDHPDALRTSRQTDQFLQRLQRNRDSFRGSGWRFGRGRLALRGADSAENRGCIYCKMCLYGCPYGCIYSTARTLAEMCKDANFKYLRDVIVTNLREVADKVFISAYHRQTEESLSYEAARVYVGAGIVPTTQILLRSQEAYDHTLRARDSQYYIFPLLTWDRVRKVREEAAYTLSQLFIEIARPAVVPRPVHLQIYGYNEIIAQTVRKSLGPFRSLAPLIEERLLIAQGYLHSDDSPEIRMTLRRNGQKDYLEITAGTISQARRKVLRVLREFRRHAYKFGAIPLSPMLQIMQPGAGFHTGGTFPMRTQPGEFESDVLGRPHGWSRVHAVDASVLPSVPATTITFPVMANAHRIGWEAAAI